jgi:NDP-sugar pyrophosphorylase family protein
LTERVPKALLHIVGRPFVFHQLDLLKSQGVERVVLCVGHLGAQVRMAVRDGREFGLAVDYSFDGDELLGTAGALAQALPILGDEFFVLNGDSYLRCPLMQIQSVYEASQRPALMTVLRNDNRWDRSNILFRDGALLEYDKRSRRADMMHIDFGLSVLSSRIFSRYEGSRVLDLADVCRDLSLRGELAAFEVAERFYEIGSPQGMRETEEFFRRTMSHA